MPHDLSCVKMFPGISVVCVEMDLLDFGAFLLAAICPRLTTDELSTDKLTADGGGCLGSCRGDTGGRLPTAGLLGCCRM